MLEKMKRKYTRIHKNTQEYTRIHKNTQEYMVWLDEVSVTSSSDVIVTTMTSYGDVISSCIIFEVEYTRIHKNTQEYTRIHKNTWFCSPNSL